jgi:adenylosuccinate lyase
MLRHAVRRCLSSSPTLPLSPLTAVTGLDGRYARLTAPLRPLLSEYALIRYRVIVELEWLRVLASRAAGVPPLDASAEAVLDGIASDFDVAAAERV